jgi:hypothetical protein
MNKRTALLAVFAGALVVSGSLSLCAAGFLGLGGPKLRPANVEIQILSQSCFQGEIEPCG